MATKATALAKIEEAKQEINAIEEKPLEEQVLFLIENVDGLKKLVTALIIIGAIGIISILAFLIIIYIIL